MGNEQVKMFEKVNGKRNTILSRAYLQMKH